MAQARDRPGLKTAPTTLAGVRQMVRALRSGQVVGLLPDQVPPDGLGLWTRFFGHDAYTMTLAARLAQQTGAAVLVVLPQVLTVFHEYEQALLGLILMVFMIFLRRGIVPSLAEMLAGWRK